MAVVRDPDEHGTGSEIRSVGPEVRHWDGWRGPWLIGLVLLGLLALSVRLPDLGGPTITHPEFYSPRIEFPDYVSHPKPRVTLPQVIQSVWARSDIHPPGFYLVAWLWNGAFGTSKVAIRSLSVLVGVLTVLLLALLAGRTDALPTALAAAAILALHGVHIEKSIRAGIWVWPIFYAVLSVVLLRGLLERRSIPRSAAYVAVLALGMWTEYSFSVFAAAQIAFVALRGARCPRVPTLLQLQGLAVLIALPVVALHLRQDLFQAAGNRNYLQGEPLAMTLEVLRLGSLVDLRAAHRVMGDPVAAQILLGLVAALGALLLALGLRGSSLRYSEEEDDPTPLLPWATRLGVASLVSVVALGYGMVLPIGWKVPLGLAVIAWVAAIAWGPAARSLWPPLAQVLRRLRSGPPIRWLFADLVVCHALVPALCLLVLGSFMNILAYKVFLIATPFVLILAMRGLGQVTTTSRRALPAILVGSLALLCVASTLDFRARQQHRGRDYEALYEALAERVRPGDLVAFRYDWYTAPIHYYFTPERFEVVRLRDLSVRLEARPVEGVWVIVFGADGSDGVRQKIAAFEEILDGFAPVDRATAREGRAILYQR